MYYIVVTTSLRIINSALSKLIGKVFYRDHKKTWQEVPNILLPYLYNRYIVCANNKYAYPNIYVLSMSPLHYSHKTNMFPAIIILNSSTIFQIYDLISYDTSCNHGHVPLHCLRELKNKRKRILNQEKWIKEKEKC